LKGTNWFYGIEILSYFILIVEDPLFMLRSKLMGNTIFGHNVYTHILQCSFALANFILMLIFLQT